MKSEKSIQPFSGYFMLILSIAILIFSIINLKMLWLPIGVGIFGAVIGLFLLLGFMAIQPNSARVLTLFGDYTGTIKESGFFWANPLLLKGNYTTESQ